MPEERETGHRVATLARRAADSRLAHRAQAVYERHRRIAPAAFFLGGVGWDAATIYRIDAVIDNVLIVLYLAALGVLIGAKGLYDAGKLRNPRLLAAAHWLPAAQQFLFGALFSVFVFFYVQSASWSETLVFLGVLIALLIANEFLHQRFPALNLQVALFYLCLASYLVYFVPIVARELSYRTFLAGSLLALIPPVLIAAYLKRNGALPRRRSVVATASSVLGLLIFLQVAFVQNWIPPAPIALRDGGIFHHVSRVDDAYRLRYAAPPWYLPFRNHEPSFAYAQGDTAFCFTAVFAPTALEGRIVHVWQHRPTDDADWLTSDSISYAIRGGRSAGYRGYTFKRALRTGDWRVRVQTEDGRLLARIPFTVAPRSEEPVWRERRYD